MPATYSAVPLMTTGDWVTAGWVNTYIGGNESAMWVGSAVGDMEYYLSSVEKARLAKPGVDSLLAMGNPGTPSWLAKSNLPGLIHASAAIYWTGEVTRTSTAFGDITSATVDIVTTVTCTIRMIAQGHIAHGTAGNRTTVNGVIGGVSDPQNDGTKPWCTNPYYVPYSYLYKRTGVAAGTITCKLQFKSGGGTAYHDSGRILVEAIPE